jgi:uridine phosphorylase
MRVAVFHPGIGSAMAAAGMEQMIALGAKYIVACGGAGVLRKDIPPGTVIVPTSAIRDEGTSYHYQPRSRASRPHKDAVEAIRAACLRHGTPMLTGSTWTTDAIFRETPGKIRARRREGCLTVEMEAAAFFAVARFRKVKFAQLLYAGDDVSGEEWDTRRWAGRLAARQRLLMLAIDAVRLMK